MAKIAIIRLCLAAAAVLGASQASAACYNLANGEPRSLTGALDYVIFAGPPNFEDVQKGDTPEPNYVLRLPRPICLTGDEFADASTRFRSVQIVEKGATRGRLKAFLHKPVTVTLTDPMAAETGHHHEPLVAWVTSVRPATARPMDFIDEYGTAATTIRAFYDALRDGQGAAASRMIVPEKRSLENFSPEGLTRFYGKLATPIRLIDIAQTDSASYIVHYRYASDRRACDGRAMVTIVRRDGRNFIQSIRTLNGC